jgi:hypothetical protein
MGLFDTILGVVGVGLDVFGQHQAASEQASAAGQNAERYRKEAEFQQYRTGVRLEELAEYKDRVISMQRVQFAKSGVVVDRNTAQLVVEETARQYDKDRQAIMMEGEFNVDRALLGVQSSLDTASSIKKASYIDIGRTLLKAGDYF